MSPTITDIQERLDVQELHDRLYAALTEIGRTVQTAIQSSPSMPVQTGRLRRSFTVRVERTSERAVVSSSVPYASVQNARRGFVRAGVAVSRDTALNILADAGRAFLKGSS
jgi:hypothetical protein